MKRRLKELMNRALRKEEGFTLVEIIVVIVIMAILAAIAVPSVLGYIKDANDAKYIAEARAIYLACQVEEAKYNASAGNTNPALAAYVFAGEGTETAIEEAVIAKFPTSGNNGSVTSIAYTAAVTTEPTKEAYYTIYWKTSDGKMKYAKVVANDEITVADDTSKF